ncbi:hypothetical protein RUM44_003812 [Polyplax serrata]|uniref:Eukaryotic translation initiation factor 2A n=1 Tax=Polyplax serrata TaxID=468196 RepID=A0ABR1B1T4_POLSC
MSATVPVVAVRGSTGISLNYGPPGYDLVVAFTRDDSKSCKTMTFSKDGRYFAWINGYMVKIVSTSTWKVLAEINRPKVSNIDFSPKGTYFVTWEPFIGNPNQTGNPNLHIWKSESGELVRAFVHKKQTGWEPQWSADEKICARLLNNDVLFYEDSNFEASVHKLSVAKVASFSLSPGTSPLYVLCYLPGNPSQPGFGRLFQYPKFDSSSSLANKSFFQADTVDMLWNNRGTEVLLMTSTDVDKTGASYYGKQTLHFISTKGETAMVMLGKMSICNFLNSPALLIFGGFGNLRGGIELWDTTNRKIISQVDAPDTTLLRWSPDGEHFVTATTAPRLREENGFKIWHYSGALLYERPWNKQEELWEVAWQTVPPGTFKEPSISSKPVEGIQPSHPQASKQAYRPPSARGKDGRYTVHDGNDVPAMSKNVLKLKKKRENKKAKKEQAPDIPNSPQTQNYAANHHPAVSATNGLGDSEVTDDPEKLKKIKKIRSKLNEITKLKEQQAAGRQLELNQVEKIKKEEELMKELNGLVL